MKIGETARMMFCALALLIGATSQVGAQSAGRDAVKTYFFGNSLVTHVSGTDDTAVPHWLAQFALANRRGFAADGQFGFLRNFAADLPPLATWGFGKVQRAWRKGAQSFGDAEFDSVIITPANFIQDVPPESAYADGSGQSPLGETLKIVDWVVAQDSDIRIFIYGGWPEMANITRGFPPKASGLLQYHRVAQGPDFEWYGNFVDTLRAARPEANIALIPVGQRLSKVLMQPPFDTIPALDLYEDDAPHGTPSLYALAAIVTYGALYEAAPSLDLQLPASVHPIIADNLDTLIPILTASAPATPLELTQPKETTPEPAPAVAATPAPKPEPKARVLPDIQPRADQEPLDIAGPDGTGLAAPVLAMGLNGIADWTAQQPFLDLMKTARPWVGHSKDTWGAFSFQALQEAGAIGPDGWPLLIPEGATRLETFVLTDMDPNATALEGTYVLRYDGTGKLEVTGRAKRPRYDGREVRFTYTPDEGLVGVALTEIDPNDPIRNITLVREDRLDLHAAGALFNPDWLTIVQDTRSVRFMDWMLTNASPQQTWDDRPRVTDFSWGWRGVPVDVMVTLANRIGADPWFTLPHMADDAYFAEFATIVRDKLDPRLIAHVEYSNELWNFAFQQTQWARGEAERRWGSGIPDDAWIQLAGARMAEMAEVWQAAYGDTFDDRVKIVIAVHTGWQGLEEAQMQAPLWRAGEAGRKPPADYADAYAVTGYFGFDFGTEAFAPVIDEWIDDSIAVATAEGEAEGKRRVALRVFVEERQFDRAFAPAANALRAGSLRELVTEIWPYHAKVAKAAGMDLVMYEGGTHVTGHASRVNDDRVTGFFTEFNYSADMARLYDTLLAGWIDVGGTMFNAFVDVATPTKWGSWGALRHLSDDNPRWQSLDRYNQTAKPNYKARTPGTFLNGITRVGGSGADTLIGTVEEDVLIGGPGNDRLISHGRGDVLHGGAGQDTAQLPGTQSAYQFSEDAQGRVLARGPNGTVTLTEIETLEFDGAPGQKVTVQSLF